jgi:hypothetical protein
MKDEKKNKSKSVVREREKKNDLRRKTNRTI